jgi:GH25 family lysozyme M1 (1,4-beta-N-acetylmuramidase)
MRKLIAFITAALCMLSGCASGLNGLISADRPTASAKESATVSAVADGITKTGARLTVTVQNGRAEKYGYELKSSTGKSICADENAAGVFNIEGLLEGTAYSADIWAETDGGRIEAVRAVAFTTAEKYDAVTSYGIDVSRWQENIDWQAVASDNIDFAIIRAGYTGGTDVCFEEHFAGARAAGLDVGVYFYCYALTAEQAKADAAAVLAQLGGRRLDYPVFYDVEDEPDFIALTTEERTAIVDAFCTEIEKAGYDAGVYTSQYWLYDYFDSDYIRSRYDVWLAATLPEPPESCSAAIWQYSHTGTVKGIMGSVDLNAAYKKY